VKMLTEREQLWAMYLATPINSQEATVAMNNLKNPDLYRRRLTESHAQAKRRSVRVARDMTDADVRKLQSLYDSGKAIKDIAGELGTSESVVNVMMRTHGIKRERNTRFNLSRELLEDLRSRGLTDAIIAERLGCSVATVRRYRSKTSKAGKSQPNSIEE